MTLRSGDPTGVGTVPSPCISVCTIDVASGYCAGCLRTVDEIAAWASLTDREKRAVWNELARRRDRIARTDTLAGRPKPDGASRA